MSDKLIQSFVNGHFVSTIRRESSVAVLPLVWFHETLVWEWDENEKERGRLVHEAEAPDLISHGLASHYAICKQIAETGKIE